MWFSWSLWKSYVQSIPPIICIYYVNYQSDTLIATNNTKALMQKFFKKKNWGGIFQFKPRFTCANTQKWSKQILFSSVCLSTCFISQIFVFLVVFFFFHFNEEWLKCHYPLLHDFAAYLNFRPSHLIPPPSLQQCEYLWQLFGDVSAHKDSL